MIFLGWTGDKVCMVGDSAGGNLTFSTCLRLIELNAKRLPDGLVPMYTPFLFQVFAIAPSVPARRAKKQEYSQTFVL